MKRTTTLLAILGMAAIVLTAVSANAAVLTWSGGAGTWQDGTVGNFDGTWASDDSASFAGTTGVVTVSGSIGVTDLTFNTTSSGYVIDGGTLNFATGGTIDNPVKDKVHTITSAITGSPTVNCGMKDRKSVV